MVYLVNSPSCTGLTSNLPPSRSMLWLSLGKAGDITIIIRSSNDFLIALNIDDNMHISNAFSLKTQ